MAFSNPVSDLFKIKYPIVQAGMVWASGWRLASAVSNAGGLGVIGSGSMYPQVLKEHIQKCKAATNNAFGVNVPLLFSDAEKHIRTIIAEQVPIVITSAGNPKTYTSLLTQHGITVVHVVSSSLFAKKSEDAGCHAVVAEGFEAGGHNGREETTTMVLVPAVVQAVNIPVIAAGGIGNGQQMAAAFALGALGVQVGSRYVASQEASCHPHFKNAVVGAAEGDTQLSLKKLTPVRLMKNAFYQQVQQAELSGASMETLAQLLGRGRAKKGMFEGDMQEGELEIGQVSALINNLLPAAEITQQIWAEYEATCKWMAKNFV